MLNKKILKSILNVKHTAIDDMKILPDGTIAIKAHPTKGEQCRCGICGRKSVRYDNGRGDTRSWRTCDWNTHKVYIVADIHRVMCPKHGVVTASVPWARHKSRFTKEFEELATWPPCPARKPLLPLCSGFPGIPSALSLAGCGLNLMPIQPHASRDLSA